MLRLEFNYGIMSYLMEDGKLHDWRLLHAAADILLNIYGFSKKAEPSLDILIAVYQVQEIYGILEFQTELCQNFGRTDE